MAIKHDEFTEVERYELREAASYSFAANRRDSSRFSGRAWPSPSRPISRCAASGAAGAPRRGPLRPLPPGCDEAVGRDARQPARGVPQTASAAGSWLYQTPDRLLRQGCPEVISRRRTEILCRSAGPGIS